MIFRWIPHFILTFQIEFSIILQIEGQPFPIGFYSLDATHGVNDTSSCRNIPGIANDTTLAPGYLEEPDTAYRFQKSQSSCIRISNNGIYNTSSITFLTWFETETSMGHQTIIQLSSEGKMAFLLAIDVSTIYLEVYPRCNGQPMSIFPDITIEAFTWYFIGVSYDPTTGLMAIHIRSFYGHQLDRSVSVGVIELDTRHDIWLGYGPGSPGAFTGSMACFQVYDEPLNEKNMTEAMKMCIPIHWSEPSAIYALNDSKHIPDSSGNSNPDGIAHNINETGGPYGESRSVAFEGTSASYVQISQDGKLSITASFSILVWIYRDWSMNSLIGNGGEIVTIGSKSGAISGLFFGCTCNRKLLGKFYFPSSDETFKVSYSLPTHLESKEGWYHIALVYNNDTGQARLHVDGKLQDKKYVGMGIVGTDADVIIGKGFKGRIACLQFYRRPLLAEHIKYAMDKCYIESPTPAVCQQRTNVSVSSCPSVVPTTQKSMVVVSLAVSEMFSSTLHDTLSTRTRNMTSVSGKNSVSGNTTITRSATVSLYSSDVLEQTTASKIAIFSKDAATTSLETLSVSDVNVTITSASSSNSSRIRSFPKPTPTSTTAWNIELSSTVNGIVASEHYGVTQVQRTTENTAGHNMPSFLVKTISYGRLISTSKISHLSTKVLARSSENTIQTDKIIRSELTYFSNIGMKATTKQAPGPSFTSNTIFSSQNTNSSVKPSRPVNESVKSSIIKDHQRSPNLSQWSAWSSCCDPCGSGLQYRQRSCSKTETEHCTGNETETRMCKAPSCEATCFNITAIFVDWKWDDLLSVENSSSFIFLETKLRQMITELYPDESVSVTLLSCRKGSVVIHFTVAFYVVKSDQMVRLTENMSSKGLLASLELVNITTNRVSSQVPTIIEAYLTSASSLWMSWTPVVDKIEGYHLAFRSNRTNEWTSLYTDNLTLSLSLVNLTNGDVYRIRVAAFNSEGNGIPSDAVEIQMVERAPRVAPDVSLWEVKNTSSLKISWSTIPAQYVNGKLLGHHVMFKALKVADRDYDEAKAKIVTKPAAVGEKNELVLTSLSSFTLYRITVAAFTKNGIGKINEPIFGETCACPAKLYTNWAPYPPYVTEIDQEPGGIIGELIRDMISYSCGTCQGGHGNTFLDLTQNGKGGLSKKTSMAKVRSDVDDKTHLSFPVIGNMDDEKYLKEFVFIPVVASPGIAFISLGSEPSRQGVITSALKKSWPIVALSLIMAIMVAIFIWISERQINSEDFSRSFCRGTGDLTWFSLITITTVGFGDRVPVAVVSKLITIIWIVLGLVLLSLFMAMLTVSLTVMTADEGRAMLYGTKVTALKDSPSHRLGIRRNAIVDPRDTLEEAFNALEDRESDGLLLDAYVAGSGAKEKTYRVNQVIDVKKGLGVVLAGDAMVLRYRIRDFVKKNAEKITRIIQNSTTPLLQPKHSTAEEKVQNLVDANSQIYRDAVTVVAGALAVSIVLGIAWELFRKRRLSRERGGNKNSCVSDMAEAVDDFHDKFKKTYNRLRKKHSKELKTYNTFAKRLSAIQKCNNPVVG